MAHATPRSHAAELVSRMRDLTAALLAPALRWTGVRFSKDYRWGTTRAHRIVNALVNTTRANQRADMK